MQLINTLNNYMTILLATLIIVGGAIAGIVFYLLKVKKIATTEEHPNYDNFERRDSTEYVKFKDIISSGDESDKNALGMIAVGDYTFIGGIEVSGYNYHSASAEERQRTMINTIAFFNVVEQPIQMRQTVQAIDLSRNIEDEKEQAARIERELIQCQADYNASVQLLEAYADNEDAFNAVLRRSQKLLHTIRSKQWMLKEAREMTSYMEKVSDVRNNTKKVNQIMFSYIYNPNDDLEELSDAEIILKAQKELLSLAQIYGGALENTGCTWRVLSADDLTNLLRRHYHPTTVDDMRLDELLNSSYQALFVSTDSLEEFEKERRGELAFEAQMQEFENERLRMIDEAKKKYDKSIAETNELLSAMEV